MPTDTGLAHRHCRRCLYCTAEYLSIIQPEPSRVPQVRSETRCSSGREIQIEGDQVRSETHVLLRTRDRGRSRVIGDACAPPDAREDAGGWAAPWAQPVALGDLIERRYMAAQVQGALTARPIAEQHFIARLPAYQLTCLAALALLLPSRRAGRRRRRRRCRSLATRLVARLAGRVALTNLSSLILATRVGTVLAHACRAAEAGAPGRGSMRRGGTRGRVER